MSSKRDASAHRSTSGGRADGNFGKSGSLMSHSITPYSGPVTSGEPTNRDTMTHSL